MRKISKAGPRPRKPWLYHKKYNNIKYIYISSALAAGLSLPLALLQTAAAEDPPSSWEESTRQWTGGFIGLHAGQAFAGRALDDIVRIHGPKGHLFGAQTGWDWQWGRWVAGIALDVSHAEIGTRFSLARGSVRWLASLRGRIGFALDPDTLLYATAGPALGRGDIRALDFVGTAVHLGLTAGGGVERRLFHRVSVFAEYRYTMMPERTYNPLPLKAGYEGHMVLVGLQFR